jgi:hypothetical protein
MYKYIQKDATILSWLLFQEPYMFRAFAMYSYYQEYITASAVVGTTYER